MSASQKITKRLFDIVLSFFGLLVVAPIIALGWLAATISTGHNGFFVQQRVGMNGKHFPLFKLRSMRVIPGQQTNVTADGDLRITKTGRILRKLKIDELPQLLNVLLGHMSLVGPRPDVPGFADKLTGEDRIILSVRPGITGPASIAYRNEEEILNGVDDPETYNKTVIWPDKIKINKHYLANYSLKLDLQCLIQTVTGQ